MRCNYCNNDKFFLEKVELKHSKGFHKKLICRKCLKFKKFATESELHYLNVLHKIKELN